MLNEMKKIYLRVLGIFILALMLLSCNQSIEKAATKNINHGSKFYGNCLVPLESYCSVESFNHIGNLKDAKFGMGYKSEVYDKSSQFMTQSLKSNLFNVTDGDKKYGIIRCAAVSDKYKNRCWGIAPTILTLFYYVLMDGPLGHTCFEKDYKFDIFDVRGSVVKSYWIKGKKNNVHTLYGSDNYEGTEFITFKNALKEFENQVSKDAYWLNSRLSEVAMDVYRESNRNINERDSVLAYWLNSEEYLPIDEIDEMIKRSPDDYAGYGLRANYYLEGHKFNSALNDIEVYCKLNPTCRIFTPYARKADILYKLNRKTEALDALQIAKRLYPDNEDLYILESAIYMDAGSVEMAYSSLENALTINSDNLEAINGIEYLKKLRKEVEEERDNRRRDEALRRAMAMQAIGQGMQTVGNSLATLSSNKTVTATSIPSGGNSISTKDEKGKTIRAKTKECSMCKGKGWIAGTKVVSFDSSHSYYCEECHREVPSSHSHDECPSCRGKGTVTHL